MVNGKVPHNKEVAMDYLPSVKEKFPSEWKDPLDLFGDLTQELISCGHDMDVERDNVKTIIDKHGAQWAWDNRIRLVSMVKALKRSAGEVG